MSDWCLETPSCSRPENRIPSGRQLLRTPPMADVKKQLNFCDEDFKAANCTPHADPNPSPAFGGSFTETAALDSMLKGMKGYQLTSSDLEFIKKMKEQQLVKKLQADLEAAQKLLKKETMLLELAYASRKMALDELDKFPSCEVLTEWAKLVLRNKACLMELDGLDVKSLLAVTTMDDVQSFMKEKKKEIDEIKRRAAEKRKKDKEKREELEKQVACEELKIQELMRQLADLKSDLSQQEEMNCNSRFGNNAARWDQSHVTELHRVQEGELNLTFSAR
uniref:Eukaryotic translation initiation factor 3 subunit A-like n=1 Tax=Kryptolebias marmoratus TaxID=37003 RepID=A0A3Q2ZH08_KRYMA